MEGRKSYKCYIFRGCRLSSARALTTIIVILSVVIAALCQDNLSRIKDGIVRGDTSRKELALVFTGDSYAEGGSTILDALKSRAIKGSFFFTGNFLRNPEFAPLIKRIVAEGHYLGPHSDRHLLYLSWERDQLLVGHDGFVKDVQDNLVEIARFGVDVKGLRYWIPPYEHYNETIVKWSRELGLTLINFSPGTISHADYTGEKDANFASSKKIWDSIFKKEKEDPHGLNGFVLLIHIGAGEGRKDKFFYQFDRLLNELCGKGYGLLRIDQLLSSELPQSSGASR
jgi:peptidoglycan/xylan/chitin deacetylase (PgdA/CDA1 family)